VQEPIISPPPTEDYRLRGFPHPSNDTRQASQFAGAVRLKEVDEAQATVVTVAKALADSGEIFISSGDEESEMIY